MGLFDFFSRRPSMEEGLAQWKDTPNAMLLDVRTPEEYQAGHIPGAKNLPLDQLADLKLPKDQPVFAYCLSGTRSAQACAWLKRQGYEATNLGGIGGYRGPLET
mgnify:FL=1